MTLCSNARPFLSVVTINLDNANGLQATKVSVFSQTHVDCLEWIVVDGGSTDGSVALLDGPNRPAHLVVGVDQGLYDAMNIGLSLASGEWVTFLNSGDEFIDPFTVAKVLGEVGSKGHLQWCYGRTARRPDAENPSSAAYAFEPFDIRRLALGTATVPHQATFLRTTFARTLGGFDTRLGIAADQDFLLRAALRSHPLVLADVIAYQEPGGRGSGRPIWKHVGDMRRFRNSSGLAVYGRAIDLIHDGGVIANISSRTWLGRGRRRLRSVLGPSNV